MSSSSIQQIRPIIECLCQILSIHGFSTINSEIFRLAKFDRTEATSSLWRLIFELIHFDVNVGNEKSIVEKFDRTAKDKIVENIKVDLFTRGYTLMSFMKLDDEMKGGSRELLLCIGWLIHHLKLVDCCIERALNYDSILDYDDTIALHRDKSNDRNVDSAEQRDFPQQIKQAMRLNSKLKFSLRRIHGLVIENANLQHQVHLCHNLSAIEAYLCQNPTLLNQYSNELEIEHRKLSLLLFWKENENVFWNWMESVLDQSTDQNEQEQPEDDEENPCEQISPEDLQRIESEKKKFYSAVSTLDKALENLENLSLQNVSRNGNEKISTTPIDDEVSSSFHELLAKGAPSNLKTSDNRYFLHQPSRLIFGKANEAQDKTYVNSDDFQSENERLKDLQTSIDQQIEKQRSILDALSYDFDNVMIV